MRSSSNERLSFFLLIYKIIYTLIKKIDPSDLGLEFGLGFDHICIAINIFFYEFEPRPCSRD